MCNNKYKIDSDYKNNYYEIQINATIEFIYPFFC